MKYVSVPRQHKTIKGNHREKWCIDILEEPDRPDKHLKLFLQEG